MAKFHDLLARVSDDGLRAALQTEYNQMTKHKKFGLVFEEHLPAEYMRKKELPDPRYRAMLIDYIGRFNGLTRRQINEYMIPEIRGELSNEEKIAKISNLMTYMRRLGEIVNTGSATKPLWKLSDKQ